MKVLILNMLLVVSGLSAHAQYPEPTVSRLVDSIHAELPKGWTVSYDKEHSWLQISRDEAVLSTSEVPNGPAGEEPEQRIFLFAFRVVAAVQPPEYRRLNAENRKIQKEASVFYEDLVRKGVNHKFDSFSPRTDEEKAAVAQYETVKKSLHTLPDFYFGNISLEWVWNPPENPVIRVTDERIWDECTKIREKVVRLLSKYDAAY